MRSGESDGGRQAQVAPQRESLAPLRESLLGKAIGDGLIGVGIHDLRTWATDRHRSVDDPPYGGGPGMVMKADVWGAALDCGALSAGSAAGC